MYFGVGRALREMADLLLGECVCYQELRKHATLQRTLYPPIIKLVFFYFRAHFPYFFSFEPYLLSHTRFCPIWLFRGSKGGQTTVSVGSTSFDHYCTQVCHVWDRLLGDFSGWDWMFSPTSLVWRVNNQFTNSLRVAFYVNV